MGTKNIVSTRERYESALKFNKNISSFVYSNNTDNSNQSEASSLLEIREKSNIINQLTTYNLLSITDSILSPIINKDNNSSIYHSFMLPIAFKSDNDNKFVLYQQNKEEIDNILGFTRQKDTLNYLNQTFRSFCKNSVVSGTDENYENFITRQRTLMNYSNNNIYKSYDDIRYSNKLIKKNESNINTKRSVPIKEEKENYHTAKHSLFNNYMSNTKKRKSGVFLKKKMEKYNISREYSLKIRKINMQRSLIKKLQNDTKNPLYIVNNTEGIMYHNNTVSLPHEQSILNFLQENLSPNSDNSKMNINYTSRSNNRSHPHYIVDIKELSKVEYKDNKCISNDYCKYNIRNKNKLQQKKKEKKTHRHFLSKFDYYFNIEPQYKKKEQKQKMFFKLSLKDQKTYYNIDTLESNDSIEYYKQLLQKEKENLPTKTDTISEGDHLSNENINSSNRSSLMNSFK